MLAPASPETTKPPAAPSWSPQFPHSKTSPSEAPDCSELAFGETLATFRITRDHTRNQESRCKGPTGLVVSDVHLFARRSAPAKTLHQLYKALDTATECVLNGDIFDFGWTKLRSISVSVDASKRYLEVLLKRYPRCTFHFVVGNHDHIKPFLKVLDELSRTHPNFKWHPSHVKIGEHLFLHGDVTNWKRPTRAHLERFREFYCAERHRGRIMNFFASLSTFLGLHRADGTLRSKHALAIRIASYLEHEDPDALRGTRHIFFGHTHVPFQNFRYRGIAFHNTGSSEKGCEGRILSFTTPGDLERT